MREEEKGLASVAKSEALPASGLAAGDAQTEVGLKPCPWCGGEASPDGRCMYSERHEAWWADGSRVRTAYFCNCIMCGARRGEYQTREGAIAAWNQRAAETEIAALEAERDYAVSEMKEAQKYMRIETNLAEQAEARAEAAEAEIAALKEREGRLELVCQLRDLLDRLNHSLATNRAPSDRDTEIVELLLTLPNLSALTPEGDAQKPRGVS